MHEFRIFGSREAASVTLADRIAATLGVAIAERSRATLVVPGGSSPLLMFRALRRRDLPWDRVTVVPSDERLVASDHADSNERMIREELVQDAAQTARFLSLAGTDPQGTARLARIDSELGNLQRPLDIVVLGMGADGHTASLFADSPDIAEAMSSDRNCFIQHPPGQAVARLTLTPTLLLDASSIVLLFFGDDKRAVYDRAIAGGDTQVLPVRFVLQQQMTPVLAVWAR